MRSRCGSHEGLSDFLTGYWSPLDLATVRDAAVADIVPKMSELQGYGEFSNPRLIYNLGHAAFEFMESRWGKEGIRQFLFSLRKSVIGGGESAYDEAFKLKAEEFDQQFEKYLKDRFKPFRDKERPMDYGRDLAPNPEKSRYMSALSAEPSPSGDLIAVFTGNRRDQEYDIVLLSSKDGQVVRNLTPGFNKDMGFQYLSIPGIRWNTVPWMSWGPGGDRVAYIARLGRGKGIVIQDVVSKKVLNKYELDVDEPESPCFSPDGKTIAFAGLRDAKSDLFALDVDSGKVTNLTAGPVLQLRADLRARRQVDRLHRAGERQREAVPPRPGGEEGDADHLRHARRHGGPVPRRRHDRVRLDGHRPGADRGPRGGAQREHLQPVDAEP